MVLFLHFNIRLIAESNHTPNKLY